MRCTKIKKNGERCKANVFSDGSDMCLFHSQTEKAKEARKAKVMTKEQLIFILQKELRRVKKLKDDDLGRSGEIRRLVELVAKLKGELQSPIGEEVEPDSLSKKLEKWQKEKEQEKIKEKDNA